MMVIDNNKVCPKCGVYDGTFDDDHIFYWFDDEVQVVGDQGDFTIESFERGV